jgi:hypothetical protein
MKFTYKGFTFELDHSTFVAIAGGTAMYIKALAIDFWLNRNKNIKSDNIIELGINLFNREKK